MPVLLTSVAPSLNWGGRHHINGIERLVIKGYGEMASNDNDLDDQEYCRRLGERRGLRRFRGSVDGGRPIR